jgi:hypothetical protein|nr:MAG TPA: hypothetical protein [Caudoviricetes sp.]
MNTTRSLNAAALVKGTIIALITGLSQITPDYRLKIIEEVTRIISTH